MFYAAGGAIGWATAPDGHLWQKGAGPLLRGEWLGLGALGSPAALRLPDGRVRLLLLDTDRDQVHALDWDETALAAGAPPAPGPLVDGDPATPALDPLLARPAWIHHIFHVSARAAPLAGRLRYDLYLGVEAQDPDDPGERLITLAHAAAFDGLRFESGRAPIVPVNDVRAPAAARLGPRVALFYVLRQGARDAIAAAVSP
jgi:hypothetical protein